MKQQVSSAKRAALARQAGRLAIAATVVLLMSLFGAWASGAFKVKTKAGTIVLENVPNDVEVLVDGENVTVTWADGQKTEIRIRPGTHKVEVKKNGFTVLGEEVTFEDGEHRVLTARIVPQSPPSQNKMLVESVLEQIGTPPIGATQETALRYDALPPFSVETFKKYAIGEANPNSPLCKAVQNARVLLWAIYPREEPKGLSREVRQLRGKIGVQLDVLRDGYRVPGGGIAEKQFKDRVEKDERKAALLMHAIDDSLQELQSPAVTEARERESSRWKANYDFMLARVMLEYTFLFEYQSMLGSMRKEFPPRDAALHGGWKLASQPNLRGDATGKKSYKSANKLLDKIIKENAGSPWEVLAKREKLAILGLEWQPTR